MKVELTERPNTPPAMKMTMAVTIRIRPIENSFLGVAGKNSFETSTSSRLLLGRDFIL